MRKYICRYGEVPNAGNCPDALPCTRCDATRYVRADVAERYARMRELVIGKELEKYKGHLYITAEEHNKRIEDAKKQSYEHAIKSTIIHNQCNCEDRNNCFPLFLSYEDAKHISYLEAQQAKQREGE